MEHKTVLLLHGFASSAQSTKAQYLGPRFKALPQVGFRALDLNPTPKDFEYMTVTGMINRLRQYVLDHRLGPIRIIGSSMGALVGLNYAHRFGGVDKMLLLAPALSWLSGGLTGEELAHWEKLGAVPVFHYAFEKEIPLRYDLQVDGLHYLQGVHDDTVPIDDSRNYAAAFPDRVQLIEVDSDHRLNDQLPFIWDYVQSFLLT
jgi:pimeloyl-ACP methyl ester carboxylesterase